MAHTDQVLFCLRVRSLFPGLFHRKFGTEILDIGSLDVNGNNRYLFNLGRTLYPHNRYTGIDVGEGKNVDFVSKGHLWLKNVRYDSYTYRQYYDVIVSTETLEHDPYWIRTVENAWSLLHGGGLLLITCATTGRAEHGTRRTTPQDSPLTSAFNTEWSDYYGNISKEDFMYFVGDLIKKESCYFRIEVNDKSHDLYVVAIKRGAGAGDAYLNQVFRPSVVLFVYRFLRWFMIRRIIDFRNALTKIQKLWQKYPTK